MLRLQICYVIISGFGHAVLDCTKVKEDSMLDFQHWINVKQSWLYLFCIDFFFPFFSISNRKTDTKKKNEHTIHFLVDTRREERRRVTESSLRAPLTISSLFATRCPY